MLTWLAGKLLSQWFLLKSHQPHNRCFKDWREQAEPHIQICRVLEVQSSLKIAFLCCYWEELVGYHTGPMFRPFMRPCTNKLDAKGIYSHCTVMCIEFQWMGMSTSMFGKVNSLDMRGLNQTAEREFKRQSFTIVSIDLLKQVTWSLELIHVPRLVLCKRRHWSKHSDTGWVSKPGIWGWYLQKYELEELVRLAQYFCILGIKLESNCSLYASLLQSAARIMWL